MKMKKANIFSKLKIESFFGGLKVIEDIIRISLLFNLYTQTFNLRY